MYAVPSALDHQHAGLRSYAEPARKGRWKTTVVLVTMAFAGGLVTRPVLETKLREFPWGASLTLLGAVSTATMDAEFFVPPAPSRAPGINTSPLPTPRTAVAKSVAPAKARVTPPAEPAPAREAPVEAQAAPKLERAAMARQTSHRDSHRDTHRARLAMRHEAPAAKSAVVEAKAAPVAEPAVAEAPPAPVARKEPAPPPDSLDALMNRAFSSTPDPRRPAGERMRFPEEKARPARAKVEDAAKPVKPERITSGVTAAATAAAKASAASSSSPDTAVVLPKLPSKIRLSDDPLSGLNGKEIEGKRQAKAAARRR